MVFSSVVTAIAGLAASGLTGSVPPAVSQDMLYQFNLFEQYSAAAYCSINDKARNGAELACVPQNCPLVQQADATVVYSFSDTGVGDVTGLLALDHNDNMIVLAFRGSRDPKNWMADFHFPLTDASSLCANCQVHHGFLDSWNSIADTLTSELNATVSAHSGYRIVVTGHSLGAALATLAAVQLRNAGNHIDLYSYGCPRVGNLDFATFLTSQANGVNYRITHTDDPVPKLPFRSMQYSQSSPEYWITAASKGPVEASNITVVQGIDSVKGNAGTPPGLDVDAHQWYFNRVTQCT